MAQRSKTRMIPDETEAKTIDLALDEEPLFTPGFNPLADFANLGGGEAAMLRYLGSDLGVFTKAMADSVSGYIPTRLPRLGVTGATVDKEVVEDWLTRSSTGPFDEGFADYIRDLTHIGGRATFPGMAFPLPPQMLIALIACFLVQLHVYLGDGSDAVTVARVGGDWMAD